MSRDIKFRAWNGSEMITQSLQKEYDDYYMLNLQGEFFPHTRTGDEDFRPYDSELNSKEYQVMQFTGLKDKNGLEIFEDDICTKMISPDENNLAPKELYRGVIVFHFGGFCLKVGDYYYPLSRQHGIVDIIGNIHQHPELLN